MGEIAEMMLDGILCEHCGALIDGEETGHPRYCCEECAREAGALWEPEHKRKRRKNHKKNKKGEQKCQQLKSADGLPRTKKSSASAQ